MRPRKIAGIIVAAGYSSRMGHFKPLLPLGGKTVLETAVDSLRQGGVADILVVVGHRFQELLPVLKKINVRIVHNPLYAEGMFSSVVAGLRALAGQTEAFFLLPGDTPLIRRSSLKIMIKERKKTGAAIIQPVFDKHRGHPPLIGEKCFASILSGTSPDGLRGILGRFAAETVEVEVPDQGVLFDIDTPDDYERLTQFHARREIPTYAECISILRKYQPNPAVLRHGQAVATLGNRIARLLNNEFGFNLNSGLITAGGIVHDLAKGRPNHARQGGKLIACLGFHSLSGIIASHMDIEFAAEQPPDESAVVFLADKLVQGDKTVTIAERFNSSLDKFSSDSVIVASVLRRMRTAEKIRDRIIDIVGINRFNQLVSQKIKVDEIYLI